MALRALMKRRELDRANAELEALRAKATELETREAKLAQMIDEAETDEERAAVEEEVEKFEAEKNETDEGIADLEVRIAGIENELAEIEKETTPAEPAADPAPAERMTGGIEVMNRRSIFAKMDMQTRTAMFERDDVKMFIGEVRAAIKEKRSITGGDLLVPEVFLGLIRESIENYSKLYKHVNVRQIGGTGNAVVMGAIPEAVWTDCCGILNELSLTFNDAEVGCWKVGGYFDICNATIEDSEIDLASEILTAIGQGIGYALDKAIVFGLGTRMPMGIFTRLAQTEEPSDYPATARAWADLSSTNIKTIADTVTGIDLFRAFVQYTGTAKNGTGEMFWVMNRATYTSMLAAAMNIDANGAIVAGVNNEMPIVGGTIEVLEFIPDNVIIGGYAERYLLAERAGTKLAQSEHYKFVEDRTVFRGTARYDGLPVIAESFVAIGINGTTPSASGISFAADTANASE